MEKQEEITEKKLEHLIKSGKYLGFGAEADAYELSNGMVLKVLHDFVNLDSDDLTAYYNASNILQFSDIENDSYYFAKKVYTIDDYVRAYLYNKCPGYNLSRLRPDVLNIEDILKAYDKFYKDTTLLSKEGILACDVMYNALYDGEKFGVIDTLHYCKTKDNEDLIMTLNIAQFNIELAYLLIDGRFENFIKQIPELKEGYNAIDNLQKVDFKEFVKLFINKLSEYCDKKIVCLKDANALVSKSEKKYYNIPKILLPKSSYR